MNFKQLESSLQKFENEKESGKTGAQQAYCQNCGIISRGQEFAYFRDVARVENVWKPQLRQYAGR